MESILTIPLLQNSELVTLSPVTIPLPAGVWTPIASVQATRMTLTVLRGNFTDPIFISPVDYGTVGLVTALMDPMPYQIHASIYPLLITGNWWALSSGGQTVTVLDTIRR